ncbi:MAG: hypothetical protein ACOZIN_22790 [Myxococcota bacterium]
MTRSELWRRASAFFLSWLTLQASGAPFIALAAHAAPLPKVVVVPFAQGSGAPDRAGTRFTQLVLEELNTRDGSLEVVAALSPKPMPAPVAASPSTKPSAAATSALEEGLRRVGELDFEPAVKALKKGIELSLADPGTADYAQLREALVGLAVAHFRMGEEKEAQTALVHLARMDHSYKLPDNYPPVFVRELEKAKKRVDKLPKGSVTIDGPPGSTAFVDGRDLGMVPVVEEKLAAGTHYIKVEGTSGERFGQVVDLKGGTAKVKASFAAGSSTVATAQATAVVADPQVGEVLTEDHLARVAQYAKLAGADFVVVGIVYRTSSRQLTAASAVYSARRQGFSSLPLYTFDHELLTANVEAFKLVEEVGKRVESFGAPAVLPLPLATEEKKVASSVDVEVATSSSRTALKPNDSSTQVRAFTRKSVLEDEAVRRSSEEVELRPHVSSGVPVWVWVLVGVGAVAAAGGTYYGVTEAARPVTGSVTATW